MEGSKESWEREQFEIGHVFDVGKEAVPVVHDAALELAEVLHLAQRPAC